MSQKLERDKGLIYQKVELPEDRNGVLPSLMLPAFIRNYDDDDELRFGVNSEMMYARNTPAQVLQMCGCYVCALHVHAQRVMVIRLGESDSLIACTFISGFNVTPKNFSVLSKQQ